MKSSVLAERQLRDLATTLAADVVTVYLSEPWSPFDRSSYLMLGTHGVAEEYEPFMRGPLRPSSVALFSAADGIRQLLVEDVIGHPSFARSSFVRAHAIRSLLRVSLRAIPFEQIAPVGLLPTMLEVFASFRRPIDRATLEGHAETIRSFFVTHQPEINEQLLRLVNVRDTARRYRRLDRIARKLAENSDFLAPGLDALRSIRHASDSVGQFILDCLKLPPKTSLVALFSCIRTGSPSRTQTEDPHLAPIHVYPPEREQEFRQAQPEQRNDDICRLVASDARSVVFDELSEAGPEWRARHVLPSIDGLSITIPLFAGNRLAWVLHVRSQDLAQAPTASLWRMVPQIEHLVMDLAAHTAMVDAIQTRNAVHALSNLPMAPRAIATEMRLKSLGRFMRADAVLVFQEASTNLVYSRWPREAQGEVAVTPVSESIAADTRHLFAREQQIRILVFDSGDGATANPLAVPYSVSTSERTNPVRRLTPSSGVERLTARLIGHHQETGNAQPRARTWTVFLPLWSLQDLTRAPREVYGILAIQWSSTPPPFTAARMQDMDALGKAMSASLASVDKFAHRADLVAWASAGVGPIHQLLKVLEMCREDVLHLRVDPSRVEPLQRRIDVVYEQLWILHQLSRRIDVREARGHMAQVTLAELVRRAVAKAMLLTGEEQEPEFELAPGTQQVTLDRFLEVAVNAVLSCAISNSARYGIGFTTVRASYDSETRRAIIQVVNQTDEVNAGPHLEEAARIASRVCEGKGADVFERLVEEVEQRGLRGIGTWIAARVTHDLLQGKYLIEHRPLADLQGTIEVTATLQFTVPA